MYSNHRIEIAITIDITQRYVGRPFVKKLAPCLIEVTRAIAKQHPAAPVFNRKFHIHPCIQESVIIKVTKVQHCHVLIRRSVESRT